MPTAPRRSARRFPPVLAGALARVAGAFAAQPGGGTVVIASLLFTAGVVAGLPMSLAAPLGVGPVAICQALVIVWPTMGAGGGKTGNPGFHRGVRLLGAGVVLAAVAMVGAGVAKQFAPTVMVAGMSLPVAIPLLGLFLAEGSFLLGLLLIPGVPLSPLGRVRRTLDGLSMGVCGLFIAWVLMFDREGIRRPGFMAVLVSCTAFCGMVIAGLRSAAGRAAAIACGGGIALSMAGMTQLTVALVYNGASNRYVACGVALLAAPLLIRRATRGLLCGSPILDPVDSDTDFGGYPLLAVPLIAALVTWVYRFARRDNFGSVSIALAVAAIVVVALRGALASFDARHFANRLAAREAYFRSLFSGSTDVMMVLTADLLVRWQSPAAARQFGLSDQDVVGRPFVTFVHPDDGGPALRYLAAVATGDESDQHGPIESRLRDGFGSWRDIEWKVADHRSIPAVAALIVHLRDIGDRKRLQHTLSRVNLVDQLTGLPNRRELCRVVAERGAPGVLMVLSLTGITGITDARGHGVGDVVLAEAGRRIQDLVGDADLPVRLEGHRFAVLTGAGAVQAQFLATRLLTVLSQPYQLPGGTARLSSNAGLAEVLPGVDSDEVLRRAELALRPVGLWERGGAVEWYDEAIEPVLRRQLAIEQALPDMLERADLDMYYQPIVELRGRTPVGVQAMVRWRHPDLGIIPSAEFMPIAERLGLADEIGDWALRRACRALSQWLGDGHDLWLSLHVAVGSLVEPAFVASVESAMDNHQVPASRLVFEVAEPELTTNRAASGRHGVETDPVGDTRAEVVTDRLAELRAMGVRIALDHFGTESTSLNRLRVLPIDVLKVDRQLFGQPTPKTAPAPAIIEVVVRLGRQLGMSVSAQGLATESDLEMALAAGCQYGQGESLCNPVPAEHLEAYLAEHRSPRP
jgi:PAS domain S-box-containing protein/diguanylate cyclase (GGDEF)-like protein